VVHHDERRPLGRLAEACVEPAETIGAEAPAALTGTSVSSATSRTGHSSTVVLEKTAVARQVRVIVEDRTRFARSSWLPGMTKTGIATGASAARRRWYSSSRPCSTRSPRQEDDVGARADRVHVRDRARQMLGGGEEPVELPARRRHVRVADLRDDHAATRAAPEAQDPAVVVGAPVPAPRGVGAAVDGERDAGHVRSEVGGEEERRARDVLRDAGAPKGQR
jgi:hypothetical protein